MSEPLTSQPDPFEQAVQEGFRIPEFHELSAEQQAAIHDGPGWVEQPATDIFDVEDVSVIQKVIDDGGSMMDVLNNFYVQFVLDQYNETLEEALRGITVPRKATRRFQIIFPDLAKEVDTAIKTHTKDNGFSVRTGELDHDPDAVKKLFVAYKLTRQLVDQNDEQVTPSHLTE